MKKYEEIKCGCGCGEKLNKYDSRGRVREYIYGHANRGRKMNFANPRERNEKISLAHIGKSLSEVHKRNIGISLKGKKRPNISHIARGNTYALKNAWYETSRGYVYVAWDNDSFNKTIYRPEHNIIAEEVMGRSLREGEIVHHINETRNDNCNDNLLVCNIGYHMSLHKKMRHRVNHTL